MFRRTVAPILRLLAFLGILMAPLLLAAVARSEEPPAAGAAAPGIQGRSLVVLRTLVLSERPNDRFPSGARLLASAPATLVDSKDGRFFVEAVAPTGTVRGWADANVFFVLDDPRQTIEGLLGNARLLVAANDRPVLTAAYAREVLRRDPARLEAWELLGQAGESLAASSRPGEGGRTPSSIALALRWGVRLVSLPDGSGYRYDGEAYRRLIALSPPAELAEKARLRLLTKCGPAFDPKGGNDTASLAAREKDIAEFLSSFPSSPRRVPFLLERARVLAQLAETHARTGNGEAFQKSREAALEAASEVSVTAQDAGKRRTADRLIARLAKSLPRRIVSERPAVSSNGFRASFVVKGGKTVLVVLRPDGREAIQPYPVSGADASTLAFDASGGRLAWDEAPYTGRRKTRLLDLSRARVFEPAAQVEPELLTAASSPPAAGAGTPGDADRYTSFLGFSPDGRLLLVAFEGFTPDGVRIPKRYFLCDAEGKARPLVIERPFSAPEVVDWTRLTAMTEKLSG
jgi:hypothetical protein